MMKQSKSILGKLLANENIEVIHDNVSTAYFDIKKRVLAIPYWKDISDPLYNLFLGHETSHALYTPEDAFHDMDVRIPGCPKSFVNIIEDIRIEKLILRRYPGLYNDFRNGYKDLLARDFFGIADTNVADLCFMDRINIHSKTRGLVDVPFSDDEQDLLKMAMGVETWDDVIEVCRLLYQNHMDNKTNTNMGQIVNNDEAETDGQGEGEGEGEGETQQPEQGQGGGSSEGEEDAEGNSKGGSDSDEEGEGEEDGEGNTDSDEEGEGQGNGNGASRALNNDLANPYDEQAASDDIKTDKAFQEAAKQLAEASQGRKYSETPIDSALMETVVPYEKVAEGRRLSKDNAHHYYHHNRPKYPQEAYDRWMTSTKKIVNSMAREFEMKKAAYRSARARTSTKGSLDVNKLHTYKYNDHLFKSVTSLADAKNHGMFMIVDYSGSMGENIGKTILQLLSLALFCRKVGIPFVAYGFTTTDAKHRARTEKAMAKDPKSNPIDVGDLRLFELINSKLGKKDFDEAVRSMFGQTTYYGGQSVYENLGGTPLHEALIVADVLIDKFVEKHRIEKMNLITLTDGDGSPLNPVNLAPYGYGYGYGNVNKNIMMHRGKRISRANEMTSILDIIRAKGVKTMNFYIGSKWQIENRIPYESKTQFKKEGITMIDNHKGYDRAFYINTRSAAFSGKVDKLAVDENMSSGKVATAFNKHSKSKKAAKLITQKFAEVLG